MKKLVYALIAASLVISTAPAPAVAGAMSSACLKSDRKAKSRKLCRCMQSVADQELSRRDQKLAASFFQDPHKAQEIRQSDRSSHEQFWKRYKAFGVAASKYCG